MSASNIWPLDAAQCALLAECQLAASDAQHITLVLNFSDFLNIERFCQSLHLLMERHPLLRASVQTHKGMPAYAIHDNIAVPVRVLDFQETHDTSIHAWRDGIFDLNQAPLWRCGVFFTAPDACELVIVIHHLIADGLSLMLLQRELEQIYLGVFPAGFATHRAVNVCRESSVCLESPVCRETAVAPSAAVSATVIGEWERCAYPLWPLKPLHPSGAGLSGESLSQPTRVRSLRIDGNEWRHIKRGVKRLGTTINLHCSTLLACVLVQHFQQNKLLLSAIGHGRKNVEDWRRVGFYARPLILGCDLDFNPTYRSLLKRMSLAFKSAWAAQWSVQAIETTALEHIRGVASQVACSFNDFSALGRTWGGMAVTTQLRVPAHGGHVLRIGLELDTEGLSVHWQYQPEKIKEDLIAHWMQAWRIGLVAMLDAPEQSLDRLHLDSILRRRQLVGQHEAVFSLSAMQSDLVRSEWLGAGTTETSFAIQLALDERILTPEAQTYVTKCASLGIDSVLNVWKRAILEVVETHPELHRVVPLLQDVVQPTLFAVASPGGNVDIDVRHCGASSTDSAIAEHVQRFVYQSYALSGGPLLRNLFLRCPQGRWLAVFCAHHVLLDAASGVRLVDAYRQRFLALLRASALAHPILHSQKLLPHQVVRDPAASVPRLHEWVESVDAEPALRYWNEQFSHCAPLTFSGVCSGTDIDTVALTYDAEITEKMQVLCRAATTTLANALRTLSAYAIAILCRTEQAFVIDELRQSRTQKTDRFTCSFVSRPVVHSAADLLTCHTLSDLLRYGKTRHRQYRMGEISRRWRKRLFKDNIEVIYNFHRMTDAADDFRLWRPRPQHRQVHIVPLLTARGLAIEIGFDSSIFPGRYLAAAFGRLIAHWLSSEEMSAAEMPSVESLHALCWLDADEQQAMHDSAAHLAHSFPEFLYPDAWLAQAASRWPQTMAVSAQGEVWDYATLSVGVQRTVATLLARYNVGRGDVIGVALPRCREFLLAVFAVMGAGGVYMPVALDTPPERIHQMFEDGNCCYLITAPGIFGEEVVSDLAARCTILYVDELMTSTESAQTLRHRQPSDACYLLFTSGSTGRPKGVLVSYEALHNRLCWMQSTYPLTPADRVLQKTSPGFDVSLWELLWPCLAGAAVVMASPQAHFNMRQLMGDIVANGITVMHFVPTVLDALLSVSGLAKLTSLRQIFCSGEVLKPASVERLHEITSASVINLYGPTEAAIDVTHWPCQRGVSVRDIPLGWPVANTMVHVVDPLHRTLPPGWIGEIALTGIQLAIGYLQRPRENAAAFVALKQSGNTIRAYLTGDLGYIDDSRCLHYLGRVDRQLKVNGIRVEPAGIENTLLATPGITQAVVTLLEGRLVAFVVAAEGDFTHALDLIPFAQRRLSESGLGQQCPVQIQVVASLPLTPSGKVDYKALPRLSVVTEDFIPVPGVEEKLASLWQSLFSRPVPHRDASFFSLGGHSLLMARLHSHIAQEFGIEIPLPLLFAHPIFSDQVRLIGRSSVNSSNGLGKAPANYVAPLSVQQERLWFIHQLNPCSTAYHMPLVISWRAALDMERVRSVVTGLMHRHVLLRSRVTVISAEPVWRMLETFTVPIFLYDVAAMDNAASAFEQSLLLPFDPCQAPLFRVHVLRLGVAEWRIGFVLHHLIADGWTVDILAGQWMAGFFARSENLPEIHGEMDKTLDATESSSLDYFDYVYWQRQQSIEPLALSRGYWLDSLEVADVRPLPYDENSSVEHDTCVIRRQCKLKADVAQLLRELANACATTVSAVLMAAMQVWQAKLTGTYQNVLGTVVASRHAHALTTMVGFFANTLPIRCQASSTETVASLVRRIGQQLPEWLLHSDVSFAELVRNSAARLPNNELFDLLFVMQPPQASPYALPEYCEILAAPAQHAKFPVVVLVADDGNQVKIDWEFSSAHFSTVAAGRLAYAFEQLLGQMVSATDTRIAQLTLVGASEAVNLLRLGEGEPLTHSSLAWTQRSGSLGFQLLQVARNRGDAVAIRHAGDALRYDQLAHSALEWAHVLGHFQLQPGMRVGVLLPRGLQQASVVWALFRLSVCYVPLNPEDPILRHQTLVDDAQLQILISDETLIQRLGDDRFSAVSRLTFTNEMGAFVVVGLPPVQTEIFSDHRYIVYTSGSTGQPKGVAMAEPTLATLLQWQCAHSAADASWKTLHFAALGFDVAIQESLATWLTGGELILIDEFARRDAEQVLALLCQTSVHRVYMPDSALQALALTALRLERYPIALRECISSGERLQNTPALRRFFSRLPLARLINQYGPAETHVVTAYTLAADTPRWKMFPPIGRAISGAQIRVLDQDGQMLPMGVAGELYIGGCLAEGYWRQPTLTAERFVDLEYAGQNGRYYRTGDRVRFNAVGELEFLGRVDEQIKRSGYRIEPMEIESTLLALDDLSDALVCSLPSASEVTLVAYVILTAVDEGSHSCDKTLQQIRERLSLHLPRYLLPDRWIAVSQIPRSVNGKKLRRPVPETLWLTGTAAQHDVGSTPTERRLAELWRALLGERAFERSQSFFDCGGHSLLATRLLHAIQTDFEVNFPLALLFEHSSLQTMAMLIDERRQRQTLPIVPQQFIVSHKPLVSHKTIVPQKPSLLQQDSINGDVAAVGVLPASFQQQRVWHSAYMLEKPQVAYVPLALRIEGVIDRQRFAHALQGVVRRHEALRTRLALCDGRLSQFVASENNINIDETDARTGYSDDAIMAWVSQQSQEVIALDAKSLMQVRWLRLADDDQVVMFKFHHLIMDGVSLGIFLKDFVWSYLLGQNDAIESNASTTVWVPTLQYGDYCYWQQDIADPVLSTLLTNDFLTQGALKKGRLSAKDESNAPIIEHWSGATEFCEILRVSYFRFIDRYCKSGVTPTHAFMALLHHVMARRMTTPVSTIAMPVSHRHQPGTAEILGLFADSVVCSVMVNSDDGFEALVQQTRRSCVLALAQQEDQLARHTRHPDNSLTPAMFQWVPASAQQEAFSLLEGLGWRVRRISVDLGVAGRPLAIQVTETASVIYLSALYQTSRYDRAAVTEILADFLTEMAALASTPQISTLQEETA